MKTLLKSTQPALGIASDLIELVDRVMEPIEMLSRSASKLRPCHSGAPTARRKAS